MPGAREPKELEKLLGLHELLAHSSFNISSALKSCSSSTGNIVACAKVTEEGGADVTNTSSSISSKHCSSSTNPQQNTYAANDLNDHTPSLKNYSSSSLLDPNFYKQQQQHSSQKSLLTHEFQSTLVTHQSSPSSLVGTPTSTTVPISSCTTTGHSDNISKLTTSATTSNINNSSILHTTSSIKTSCSTYVQYKGWFIQPACAITGEGLQEGLEALYDMILKRRKLQKIYKKKR